MIIIYSAIKLLVKYFLRITLKTNRTQMKKEALGQTQGLFLNTV